jgi:hypothetical protein
MRLHKLPQGESFRTREDIEVEEIGTIVGQGSTHRLHENEFCSRSCGAGLPTTIEGIEWAPSIVPKFNTGAEAETARRLELITNGFDPRRTHQDC